MNWALILSGVLAAVLLALALNVVAPLGHGLGTLSELAGVTTGVAFVALADGS